MHALSPIDLVLWIAACICLALGAFNVASPRVNLVALGLLLAGLTFVIG